jgi:hypothetical protein
MSDVGIGPPRMMPFSIEKNSFTHSTSGWAFKIRASIVPPDRALPTIKVSFTGCPSGGLAGIADKDMKTSSSISCGPEIARLGVGRIPSGHKRVNVIGYAAGPGIRGALGDSDRGFDHRPHLLLDLG